MNGRGSFGIVIVIIALLIAMNARDIYRYLKISSM
jgi:hypothetical protein